jgi:hypothetical protein
MDGHVEQEKEQEQEQYLPTAGLNTPPLIPPTAIAPVNTVKPIANPK